LKRTVRRFLKFIKLSKTDQLLLARAWGVLWVIKLGLWVVPFRNMKRFLTNENYPVRRGKEKVKIPVKRVAWTVSMASRYVPNGKNCLLRAATTHHLLKRIGHPSVLHIGVDSSTQGTLDAHAWVESNGEVVVGNLSDLDRFAILLPPRREK
jgi:transglutaminase superfamily protein